MDKRVNVLDGGSLDENIRELKDFLGLSPDQSFQDLDVNEDDED